MCFHCDDLILLFEPHFKGPNFFGCLNLKMQITRAGQCPKRFTLGKVGFIDIRYMYN